MIRNRRINILGAVERVEIAENSGLIKAPPSSNTFLIVFTEAANIVDPDYYVLPCLEYRRT